MNRLAPSFSIILLLLLSACYQPVSETGETLEKPTPAASESIDPSTESLTNASPADADIDTSISKPMNDKTNKLTGNGFRDNAAQNLARVNLTLATVANQSNPVEKRVFEEYGAIYLTKAKPPVKAMFTSETAVTQFQNSVEIARENIGGSDIELQRPAMDALKKAIAEANGSGLKITPRDGKEAGRRSYTKTLELWNSRFEPALKHWKGKGRLNDTQITRLRSLPIGDQVAAVLELENDGIFFNTFFNNSILYSVAAPGTSQHLSMLAFDVTEFANMRVQQVMGKNGWFRTVENDAPHFTYLGYQESELSSLGLKKVNKKDGEFWIPSL